MKIYTNPNKETVTYIRNKLKENDGYCPCKLSKIPDNKCMCKDFLEIEEGECHCGLFIKERD